MAKIKLPKRAISGAAKKRARRMGVKRLGKRFAKNLLNAFSVNDYGTKREERDLRDWRRSLYASSLKKQLANVIDEPPLDSPRTEGNLSNPDISALNEQLKKVLKTAKAMGLVDKETQNLALKQIREANRTAKEQQLETPQPQAVPEPQEGTGNEISPLADKMSDLIKAFEDLIDTVEDKNDEDKKGFLDNLADRFGFGEQRKRYKEKPARLKEGFKAERTASGKVRYRGPDGRLTTPEKALQGGYAKKQIVKEARATRAARTGAQETGLLGRLAGKFTGAKPVAAAIGKASAAGGMARSATGRIAKGIKTGIGATKGAAVKGAALTGQALKTAIIKVAGPKIGKALATTGIKSIPVLGTIAGLGFAASRLVDGDFVGAGLDAVSGLAGPVTAIPAMVASLSRDIYRDVFGVQPETDPQFGERMTIVKSTVQGLVENQLGKKVQTKDQAAAGTAPEKRVPPPQAVKQTSSAPSSQVAPPPPPQPAPSSAAKPIDASKSTGGDVAATTSAQTPSAPAVSTGGQSAPSTPAGPVPQTPQVEKPSAPEQVNTSPGAVAALTVPPNTQTGAQIEAATEAAEKVGVPKPKIGVQTVAIKPARTPTTKTGAKGMGNVPEPTYGNVGTIAKQLYFSAGV